MKKRLLPFIIGAMLAVTACQETPKENWTTHALNVASHQLKLTATEIADSTLMPRSIWTGYDVDFLVSQMEQNLEIFQDSLWPNTPVQKIGKEDYAIYITGRVVSSPVVYGTHMN